MNCAECREFLTARIEGLLNDALLRNLESHLQDCAACRAEEKALMDLRGRLSGLASRSWKRSLRPAVMDRIEIERNLKERRRIMKGRFTKGFAVAASIAALALILVAVFAARGAFTRPGSSTSVAGTQTVRAYSISKTIEAQKKTQTVHVTIEPVKRDSTAEVWVEFDEQGNPVRVRADSPDTSDGLRVVLWQDDKARVWAPDKNVMLIIPERDIVKKLGPLWGDMPLIEKQAASGKAHVEVVSPSDDEPRIQITVTYVDEPTKKVFYMDPASNLPVEMEAYTVSKDGEQFVSRMLYTDYDRPFGPEVFGLDLPDDISILDQTAQDIGLAKGDMSDEEIASEVVRQFLDALAAKDYTKAGKMFQGIPAKLAEDQYGTAGITRILSIEEPVPATNMGGGAMRVAVEAEAVRDGETVTVKGTFNVRPNINQPDRWGIVGGTF